MTNRIPEGAHQRLLLTAKEAAAALNISERKLWAMTSAREICHVRLGRSVRYPLVDLERMIDERKEGGRSRE